MKDILNYAVLVNIPSLFTLTLFFAYLFDFKHKMPNKKILLFTITLSFLDAISKFTISDEYHTILGTILNIVLLILFFKINPLNAVVSFFVLFVLYAVMQTVVFLGFSLYGVGADLITQSLFYSTIFGYIVIAVMLLTTYIIAKKKLSIKWFRRFELLSDSKFESYVDENIRFIAPSYIIFFLVIAASFATLIYETTTKKAPSSTYHFLFNVVSSIAFLVAYNWLLKRFKEYKNYKTMYEYAKAVLKRHETIIKEAEAKDAVS